MTSFGLQAGMVTLHADHQSYRCLLIWFAGLVFVFAAANKNDPYLIAMRGPGNIALAIGSVVASLS